MFQNNFRRFYFQKCFEFYSRNISLRPRFRNRFYLMKSATIFSHTMGQKSAKGVSEAHGSAITNEYKGSVIVIGISGATRAGKGTLATYLKNVLPKLDSRYNEIRKLGQDHFFDFSKVLEELKNNWDCPEAIDHDKFYNTIAYHIQDLDLKILKQESNDNAYNLDSDEKHDNTKEKKKIQKVLILEGFMLYHEKRVVDLCNVMIWLEVPEKVCRHRRETTKPVPAGYFDKRIWPNYIEYRKRVMKQYKKELIQIDATKSVEFVLNTAVEAIIGKKYAQVSQENDKK